MAMAPPNEYPVTRRVFNCKDGVLSLRPSELLIKELQLNILNTISYWRGTNSQGNQFVCEYCEMFPTRRSRKTKFHCARGALKHVLQEHFALLVLMQNGHHNIVQCPACLKKFRPAHAVEHLVSCIQMICNACLRVLDVVNPIKLQPDLTLSGYCICGDQYSYQGRLGAFWWHSRL